MNTAQWQKPALLIYRDGRIQPEPRIYEGPNVVLPEMWPLHESCSPTECPHPILKRYFRFIGEAGPYAVYAEI